MSFRDKARSRMKRVASRAVGKACNVSGRIGFPTASRRRRRNRSFSSASSPSQNALFSLLTKRNRAELSPSKENDATVAP